MRDIKYRFWSVAGMQQVECIELDTARVRLTDGDCRDIKEGFLMQYTGLQDKNGKEIYEGDIVMIGKELIEVVKWVGDGEWMGDKQPLVGFVHHQSIYKEPVEIIGNIYENEEAEREKRRQEAMKREKEWRENNIIDVGGSDDYYSLDVGDMSFYYGYEETMCPEGCKCSIDDDDCDKKERCFVARRGKEELMRIPTSKLTYKHRNIEDMVLLGVGMYIASLSTS